ncbi:MAG: hypothetical protein AB1782_20695 [Cyanobacteriota bacterium]
MGVLPSDLSNNIEASGGYKAFLEALGQRESGGRYNIENRLGYIGKYQWGEAALHDAGYYNDTNYYNHDWNGTWTDKAKKFGVESKDDFLETETCQEQAIRDYMDVQWRYMKNHGDDKYIGKTVNGVKITLSGLLAGYHLAGHSDTHAWLESGGTRAIGDGNEVLVQEYIQEFDSYFTPYHIELMKDGYNNASDELKSHLELTLKKINQEAGGLSDDALEAFRFSESLTNLLKTAKQNAFQDNIPISQQIIGLFDSAVNNIFDQFIKAQKTISPLILDLDGDGVETLSINNGTYFDHNADGFSELTGWASPDDGLLVLDINDNGLIDSGRELFGEHTLLSNGEEASGGFEALAELDSNLDGKIDSNDTQFSDLKIWIDANSDGITDSGELHSLGELNIESISLNFENVNKEDAEGNLISQAGSYTTTDQVTHDLSDIKFQVNNVFSQSVETLEISPEVEALPNAKGYGVVYDLHQAIQRPTSAL